MVTPRPEVEVEQKKELAAWQAGSLYGLVSEVDRKTRRITLEVSSGGKTTHHSVELSPDTVYWFVPANFKCLSDAVTGSLDRVAAGDRIYVRGSKDSASQTFVARLVVAGGFRSFAATIDTMELLDDQIRVHLVLSGNPRTVHIRFGELFTIGQVGGAAPSGSRRLYPIEAADLQSGDTGLILGTDDGPSSLQACALIVGFSPGGVVPPDPSEQLRWIFDNVFLGDPDLTPLTRKP